MHFSLWLTKRIEHPMLSRVEVFGPNSYGHHFRLAGPKEVDRALKGLICEAYAVGRQEHLPRS